MTRPTVIDIAREAGVSLATVDRVLNARPGVRAKTIDAVQDAIARLGYVRDMAAANLARSRSYRMVALLPDTDSQFVQTLADALTEAAALAAASRTELDLRRYPPEDMHILAERLAALSPEDVAGVALMAPETPVIRDAIRALKARGIPLVALASDLPNTDRDHFIGTDSHAAGRTAGVLMGRFCRGLSGSVLAVADSMLLRDSIERRRGFDEVMQAEFPRLHVRPTIETHGSPEALRRALGDCLATLPDVVGIYLIGSGHRALAAHLRDNGLLRRFVVIGHELTPHTRQALIDGHLDAVIAQNPGHLARSTLRVLRAKADRAPIDEGQEQLRIEVVIRENLPPDP
ncbi:LacI family DNA-binding transcriptional regulator [Tabrizicola sp. M-4]|uniref:LacI family DNA-binding transcriptional regulator n=1 Tax=Tabrizicola sp. M-4 TaxID=3055847 RepID=UPI003DA8C609